MSYTDELVKSSIRKARLEIVRNINWGLLNDQQLEEILDKLEEINEGLKPLESGDRADSIT